MGEVGLYLLDCAGHIGVYTTFENADAAYRALHPVLAAERDAEQLRLKQKPPLPEVVPSLVDAAAVEQYTEEVGASIECTYILVDSQPLDGYPWPELTDAVGPYPKTNVRSVARDPFAPGGAPPVGAPDAVWVVSMWYSSKCGLFTRRADARATMYDHHTDVYYYYPTYGCTTIDARGTVCMEDGCPYDGGDAVLARIVVDAPPVPYQDDTHVVRPIAEIDADAAARGLE
jgi:hypothetical protein